MIAVAKQGQTKPSDQKEKAPRESPVVVHLSDEEKSAVKAAADNLDRSVSWWIRNLILKALEADE